MVFNILKHPLHVFIKKVKMRVLGGPPVITPYIARASTASRLGNIYLVHK